MNELSITDIYFVPMSRNETFIGFVSFRYGNFSIKGVAVHEHINTLGKFWLVYPEDSKFKRTFMYPTDKETHQLVEDTVSKYLRENWNSETRVLSNQRKATKKGSENGELLSEKEVEGAVGEG